MKKEILSTEELLEKKMQNLYMNRLRLAKSTNYSISHPCYSNTSIDSTWEDYTNFKEWLLNNDYQNNYQYKLNIDKDILQWNNTSKIYSPTTCLLIPEKLNKALIRVKPDFSITKKENGVLNVNMYGKLVYIGTFTDDEEYQYNYKKYKCSWINSLIQYSQSRMSNEHYELLLNSNFYKLVNKYSRG